MANQERHVGTISMAGLKVGNVRFYQRDGKVFSRPASVGHIKNDRRGAQMVNRLRFSSVQLMWKCFKDELRNSFEEVRLGKSAYTTFMRLNHNNGVFLTKTQQGDRFQVVTPLHISEGSLEPIQQEMAYGQQLLTGIALGNLVITAETTIGDFSRVIVDNNPGIKNGDELHFVAVRQLVAGGSPRCEVEQAVLQLDIFDARSLLAVLGKYPVCNKDGFLASKTGLERGCYAVYQSREEGQNVLVSSQMLVSNNDELISEYISEAQFTLARNSFGKSSDPFVTSWKFETPTFE